jgi:hypothetical protein
LRASARLHVEPTPQQPQLFVSFIRTHRAAIAPVDMKSVVPDCSIAAVYRFNHSLEAFPAHETGSPTNKYVARPAA